MKALVLSGGRGTRLRPLTNTSAKQLFPVANKPVLFYGLEAIRDAGIVEVGIVVGDTGAEIRSAVGDGAQFGLRITYLQQEAPLGLAHCVLIARDFLGDDDFVMYLRDNFLVGGIQELVAAFSTGSYSAQILLTRVDDPRSYGVAELGRSGQILGLVEKPDDPASDLAIVGVYMFTPAVHEAVRAIRPSRRGELEITDAVQWLIGHGHHIHSHLITGYWKDTGRVRDMLECNRIVLESIEGRIRGTVDARTEITGRVVIEPGAVIEGSVLRGPIVVGADTKIVDSYLGPFTSIGDGCTLEDAEIEYSIVMSSSTIRGVSRIEASLIGKGVEVTPARKAPNTHQLVLGDHSTVRLHG